MATGNAKAQKPKAWHENYAKFFESPTRESLRNLLKTHGGESAHLDFKAGWPSHAKLGKHILALANTGGGCLIVGVNERDDKSLEPSGLDELCDPTQLQNGYRHYLPQGLVGNVEVVDFAYDDAEYGAIKGKRFQVMFVESKPSDLPYVSVKGGEGIKPDMIYVRRGPESVQANHEELQRVINRRIDTGYSSSSELELEEHLAHLKILYGQISKHTNSFGEIGLSRALNATLQATWFDTPNPKYPREDYDAFIIRMIEKKKRLIEEKLEVPPQLGYFGGA